MTDILLFVLPWLPVFYLGMRWERHRKKPKRTALKRRIDAAKKIAQNTDPEGAARQAGV